MPPGFFRSKANGMLHHKTKEFWSVKDKETGDFVDQYVQHEDEEKLGE